MLTAAKLVAGILYAGLAWYISQLIKPLFPEGTDTGFFAEVNAVVAFFVAWQIAGSRAGTTWTAAVSYGLTTTVAMTCWALFLHSGGEMVRKSLQKLYDGPSEAIVDIFALSVEHALLMARPEILGMLAVGGVLAAILVEITGRNFR